MPPIVLLRRKPGLRSWHSSHVVKPSNRSRLPTKSRSVARKLTKLWPTVPKPSIISDFVVRLPDSTIYDDLSTVIARNKYIQSTDTNKEPKSIYRIRDQYNGALQQHYKCGLVQVQMYTRAIGAYVESEFQSLLHRFIEHVYRPAIFIQCFKLLTLEAGFPQMGDFREESVLLQEAKPECVDPDCLESFCSDNSLLAGLVSQFDLDLDQLLVHRRSTPRSKSPALP